MAKSVHFYNKLLGLKILYEGQEAYFPSLQTLSAKDTILNLEQGHVTGDWGADHFLCWRRRQVLGIPEREGIQSC